MATTTDSSRPERDTVRPTEADESALRFEQAIREKGESQARWSRLMALLEEGAQ